MQEAARRGGIEHLVQSLRGIRTHTPELSEAVRIEAAYFESHANRMRYAEFRQQDLFVGRGVIEAGCRTVFGRLKRSGMFWTVDGANAIITLRCVQLSSHFEEYCEDRAAAQVPQNCCAHGASAGRSWKEPFSRYRAAA